MKYTLIIMLFSLILLPNENKSWVKGKWVVDYILKDGDTIYKCDNYSFTLNYNRTLNPKADSIALNNFARESFENTSKLFWEFRKSTFQTVAMRSGGRGNLNDLDLGTYYCSNDTLYMTNKTRNNYKSIFLMDEKCKSLYLKDKSDLTNYSKLKRVR